MALVLVPSFVSRNKHYALFTDPVVRSARSRARLVRSLLVHLSGSEGEVGALDVLAEAGGFRITFTVPALGLSRSVWLTSIERAVLGYAGRRAGYKSVPSEPGDLARVQDALSRLTSAVFTPLENAAAPAGRIGRAVASSMRRDSC